MTEPRDLPDDPGGPPTDATGFALVDEHVDENSTYGEMSLDEATRRLARLRSRGDLRAASRLMASLPDQVVVDMFERSADRDRAVAFRLLPKGRALVLFEALDAPVQSELLRGLREEWIALLPTLDLSAPSTFPWPDRTLGHTVTWVNAELMKNVTEIGQLRLLRAAAASGHFGRLPAGASGQTDCRARSTSSMPAPWK